MGIVDLIPDIEDSNNTSAVFTSFRRRSRPSGVIDSPDDSKAHRDTEGDESAPHTGRTVASIAEFSDLTELSVKPQAISSRRQEPSPLQGTDLLQVSQASSSKQACACPNTSRGLHAEWTSASQAEPSHSPSDSSARPAVYTNTASDLDRGTGEISSFLSQFLTLISDLAAPDAVQTNAPTNPNTRPRRNVVLNEAAQEFSCHALKGSYGH